MDSPEDPDSSGPMLDEVSNLLGRDNFIADLDSVFAQDDEAECPNYNSGGGAINSLFWPSSSSSSVSMCIHERALLATKNVFSLSSSRACLARVFDSAMADKRPFHNNSHNNNNSNKNMSSSSSHQNGTEAEPDPNASQGKTSKTKETRTNRNRILISARQKSGYERAPYHPQKRKYAKSIIVPLRLFAYLLLPLPRCSPYGAMKT
jgi:hypothetical protein